MSKNRQPVRGRRRPPDDPDAALLMRSYAVTHPPDLGLPERTYADWDQFVFAIRGVLTVQTPGGEFVVPTHRALWVPAGTPHAVRTAGTVVLRTLFFRPRAGGRRLPRTCTVLDVTPLVRELVLHAAARNTLRRDVAADRRLALVILDQLTGLRQQPLQIPLPHDGRARRAAEILLARHGALPLPRVAKLVGSSMRTLERTFLAETGLTAGAWRRRARLGAALRLLAAAQSVTEVAIAVGYQTPSAFIAAFRREFGITPGRYYATP
jgi:AraC-like DNA-binding protein/mannose-6-phosphate isomerase-like protein (cupin superfamily)